MPLYSDIAWRPTELPKGLVEEVAAVYQGVNTILSTRKGERIFNPEFGSNLDDFLFEPMDELTELALFHAITNDVERWEPRIVLMSNRCSVVADYDNQTYELTLVFKILGVEEEAFTLVGVFERRV